MNTKRFLNYLSLIIVLVFYLSCSSTQVAKTTPPPPLDITSKDKDGDGVKDESDKCPDVAGSVTLLGCPDKDGDGIADNEDKCPDIFGVTSYKGCPIPDTDNDGISDELDKCPNIPGSASNYGCPLTIAKDDSYIKDSNGDRVPNNKDDYPNIKGNKPNEYIRVTNKISQSIIKTRGTSVVENNEDTAMKTASLGYSYYPKIKQNETKDFRVFVKINGEGNIIYQKIRSIEKIEGADDYNTDTSKIVILPYKIDLYKKLKILLEVDAADFKIVPQTPEEQDLDLVNGNQWHWNLRAVANSERVAQITMKIIAIKPEGDTINFPSKQVNIKVAINNSDPISFSTKISDWMGNNIQYVIGSIITPFCVFLYGRRKKKKEEIRAAKANEKAV